MTMLTQPRVENPSPLLFIPDTQYGQAKGAPLLLDVLAPPRSSAVRPAVIWLHGFGWFAGTRRDHLEVSNCVFLAAHGFFTVSIEYRLSGDAPFPAQIHDVKAAIRWLRAHAATYGIDPAHIGIWGASAGGHLAALAGVTGDQPEWEGESGSAGYSSRVQAVAIASAPSDFLQLGGAMAAGNEDPAHPVTQLFGGAVAERADLMRRASPLHQIRADAAPFFIAHGTLDETVPFTQGQRFYEALRAAGVAAEFVPLEGRYHNWMEQAESPIPGREETWKLGPLALPFFDKHLRPPSAVKS